MKINSKVSHQHHQSETSMVQSKKLHIAMFPWLAFGHIIPYFELGKLIARKSHHISFISTPRNIDCLPKIPPHLTPLITLVILPLPHVENLPARTELELWVKGGGLTIGCVQQFQPLTLLLLSCWDFFFGVDKNKIIFVYNFLNDRVYLFIFYFE